MFFVVVFLFSFMFAHGASAATYYVSPSGSNTAPYDTWAKAASLPHVVVSAASGVAGPHTILIASGIYNSYLDLTAAGVNLANVTILGV